LSKEEVVTAIRQCTGELGHCPTLSELKKLKGIGLRTVRRYFGSYAQALREAGFDPQGPGYRVNLETLFADWARVVRQIGRVPGLAEYAEHSRHSVGPLLSRFGGWTEVPRGLLQFAAENRLESEWKDVLEMIQAHEGRHRAPAGRRGKGKPPALGPIYGSPLTAAALAHAPTNEIGVVYLFGMLAAQLGFVVTRMQREFPDCEAMRQVEPNQWQRVRLEFEFESRSFLTHRHPPEDCDLIVCWVHNWPECPESLEVVELSSVMGQLADYPQQGLQR
jgi:Homing endonuclease associated repeat